MAEKVFTDPPTLNPSSTNHPENAKHFQGTRQGREGLPFLSLIIAALIVVRIAYVLLFGQTLTLEASGYDVYAQNVRDGVGYTRFADRTQDSDLPPLYPYFLVGVYSTLGRDARTVALVQIGLDVITALAIYRIGWHVGGTIRGRVVGLLAAGFFAFYPYLLFQNLSVNDTGLFIALIAVGIMCTYEAGVGGRRVLWFVVGAGLCLGLAALTKTLIVLALPTLGLWLISRYGLRRGILLSVVLGIAFLAPIVPWVIRNTRLHGQLVLISTNDGSNLYQGNNPCVADFMANGWDAQWVNCLESVPEGLSETAESAWMRDTALRWLGANVSEWPRLALLKLWTTWTPELLPRAVPAEGAPRMINDTVMQYETPFFQFARIVHVVFLTPLFGLAIIGLYMALRAKRPVTPILAIVLAITVAYLIFHPSTRYRSPADPFIFVLSAYAVAVISLGVLALQRKSSDNDRLLTERQDSLRN